MADYCPVAYIKGRREACARYALKQPTSRSGDLVRKSLVGRALWVDCALEALPHAIPVRSNVSGQPERMESRPLPGTLRYPPKLARY